MGVDAHSLSLLRYAKASQGGLGRTATLGRLVVFLGPRGMRDWVGDAASAGDGPVYCEPLLKQHFGATDVDSVDNSPYEGATVVADMNKPVPDALVDGYDTVLDFGCTEHIFDVAQSFRNIIAMCKPGGRILHVVPANGYCGHGFYQFSPELFLSCYSEENGFEGTEVYLANLLDVHHWYKVIPPADGQRVNIRSANETYVIVMTKRKGGQGIAVQQSDYVHVWDDAESAENAEPAAPRKKSRYLAVAREMFAVSPLLAKGLYKVDAMLSPTAPKALNGHPQLIKVRTDSLWGA